MAHNEVGVSDFVKERLLRIRGDLRIFRNLDPAKTALVIIDMQNAFLEPGGPIEVPSAREIVEPVNRVAQGCRELGVPTAEPPWLDEPALSRITVSTPEVHRWFRGMNDGRQYADQHGAHPHEDQGGQGEEDERLSPVGAAVRAAGCPHDIHRMTILTVLLIVIGCFAVLSLGAVVRHG